MIYLYPSKTQQFSEFRLFFNDIMQENLILLTFLKNELHIKTMHLKELNCKEGPA